MSLTDDSVLREHLEVDDWLSKRMLMEEIHEARLLMAKIEDEILALICQDPEESCA